jgi:hypothetical protein
MVRVMERVLPGHELTVSYMHTLHLYQPERVRRQRLKRTYGFDCACRCDSCSSSHASLFRPAIGPASMSGVQFHAAPSSERRRGRAVGCNVLHMAALTICRRRWDARSRCEAGSVDPMESLFEAVLCPMEGCCGRVASRMSTLHGRCGVCSASVDIATLGAAGKKVRMHMRGGCMRLAYDFLDSNLRGCGTVVVYVRYRSAWRYRRRSS